MSKNLKKGRQPQINIEGPFGAELYKDRLSREERAHPHANTTSIDMQEDLKILGVAGFLNQLEGEAVITHPRHNLLLHVTRNMGPQAVHRICNGEYAHALLYLIENYVAEGDRILDIGTGFGLTSALGAQLSGNEVLALEPDRALHEAILKNASLNKAKVNVQAACVLPGITQGQTEFYVAREVWSSSVFADNLENEARTETVDVVDVSGLAERHKHNTLVIDVQGAEIGLFETGKAQLPHVEKVLIRIHTPLIGEKATAHLIDAITSQGFALREIKDSLAYSFLRR